MAKAEQETSAPSRNQRYLVDEKGEIRRDKEGRPITNPDYVYEDDGTVQDIDLEWKVLCNITHGTLTLPMVKLIKVPDQKGGTKEVLTFTGQTKVFYPGDKVRYPAWLAQHPKTGWVVATKPGAGETHTMWVKAKELIWWWQHCMTDDIFIEIADAYKAKFNDLRPEIIQYIDNRRARIMEWRKRHSVRP